MNETKNIVYSMECYSLLKRNEVLIHAPTWMNPEDMPSERSQSWGNVKKADFRWEYCVVGQVLQNETQVRGMLWGNGMGQAEIWQWVKAGVRIPNQLPWLHQSHIWGHRAKSTFRTRKRIVLSSFRAILILKQMDLSKSILYPNQFKYFMFINA